MPWYDELKKITDESFVEDATVDIHPDGDIYMKTDEENYKYIGSLTLPEDLEIRSHVCEKCGWCSDCQSYHCKYCGYEQGHADDCYMIKEAEDYWRNKLEKLKTKEEDFDLSEETKEELSRIVKRILEEYEDTFRRLAEE